MSPTAWLDSDCSSSFSSPWNTQSRDTRAIALKSLEVLLFVRDVNSIIRTLVHVLGGSLEDFIVKIVSSTCMHGGPLREAGREGRGASANAKEGEGGKEKSQLRDFTNELRGNQQMIERMYFVCRQVGVGGRLETSRRILVVFDALRTRKQAVMELGFEDPDIAAKEGNEEEKEEADTVKKAIRTLATLKMDKAAPDDSKLGYAQLEETGGTKTKWAGKGGQRETEKADRANRLWSAAYDGTGEGGGEGEGKRDGRGAEDEAEAPR
uniref:Uncharacterized protein n=1 Tax=Chromera velia CCMP2878 TaxID=1169474 RepID=A0A0G4HJF4_9ALVE|eukprot:Cvel_7124.t1-p1 / transcript=Cvel_7124.t1 / gene=Cvel_7124 / organism=Chromera_velia_CCMP2878 / gene_product=hypothetical protein / transcript_product=hypothetical protein / location=Cvel_scaffold365:72429-75874(-) / protein_length=265 / sequence_SO=supercontig / SO=protein_coding / is_pseudo=false